MMRFRILLNNLIQNDRNRKILILTISLLFLSVNLYFITKEFYLFALSPLVLILLYLYFTALDLVFFATVFLTPLSFQLVSEEMNLGISVPAEPMFFGILLLFILKILFERPLESKLLRHPVSIFIMLQLMWMLIATLTSQIPLVSTKYFVMQLWFILPVYYFGQTVFQNKNKIYLFLILLTVSVSLTSIYTTIHHSFFGFGEQEGKWVMQPFYNDHTAYGAILAMILPVAIGMGFRSTLGKFTKIYLLIATLIILTGVYLSYSRATWLSIALALGFYLILVFKIKFKYILLVVVISGGFFYLNYDQLMMKLSKNRQDSSQHFVEHVQSITNISTDASNLERINRWKAAFRMIDEFPIFGTGPGTYQFLYAPYQKYKDKTIISTNAGTLGNAHSEYIGPLVERGIFGLLFFLCIIISVFVTGIKTYYRLHDKETKMIVAITLTGLFSYLMHGFMNNFLDTENASVIFWGFIAIIVKISVFSKQDNNLENQTFTLNQKY
jgi:putative inorganic carbon (hco3(-)) transporter